MTPDTPLKDYLRDSRLINQRAIIALVVSVALILLVVARLVYLQVLHHEHFTTLSRDNRVKLVAVPPTRGLIYDRNGVLLAQNIPSFSLEVVPEQVKDLKKTLAELRQIIEISDADIERFQKSMRRRPRFEGLPLRFHLSEEEVARFAINRPRFPGVDIQARLRRDYPAGMLAAHVLGYVGQISEEELQQVDASNYTGTSHIGKTGVERFYEPLLHGRVGVQQIEINAQGRLLRVLEETAPVPGVNLYLSLDLRLQMAAEAALGEYTGAIVAIDPRNGEVLALVSRPSYDPNLFVGGIDPITYAALQNSPDRPLYNRALRGQYPPGSTIKPFMGLAGLEYGVITPSHRTYCPGWFRLAGSEHKFRCWRHGGHGTVDLQRAVVESCDVFFYDLALALNIDRMHAFLDQFGLGRKTEIDLPGELTGLLPSRAWKRTAREQGWYPGETIINGIGQGYMLVTPLQLAAATAYLANHGLRMQPRVLYARQDPHSGKLDLERPRTLGAIPMPQAMNWDSIIGAMTQVVHGPNGTARAIGIGVPFRIAGKTGTAQVFGLKQDEKYDKNKVPEELRDHALFVAFAPADNPRIALAVVVEHGGSGSGAAAPLARQILDAYHATSPL
jgi:penicillin-binding protein 2